MTRQRIEADIEVSETFLDFGGEKLVKFSLLRCICRGFQGEGPDIYSSSFRNLEDCDRLQHYTVRNIIS